MIPPAFDYHAPRSVAEAITLLSTLGDEAKLLAGGHSLLPMMKLRFAQPGTLIDINRIPELRGISEQGGLIRIGAMTSESELISSPLNSRTRIITLDTVRMNARVWRKFVSEDIAIPPRARSSAATLPREHPCGALRT